MDIELLVAREYVNIARMIGAGLAALSFGGVGVGLGIMFAKALSAVGRNPAADAKIRFYTFLGLAMTEACAIYGLAVALLILFT